MKTPIAATPVRVSSVVLAADSLNPAVGIRSCSKTTGVGLVDPVVVAAEGDWCWGYAGGGYGCY